MSHKNKIFMQCSHRWYGTLQTDWVRMISHPNVQPNVASYFSSGTNVEVEIPDTGEDFTHSSLQRDHSCWNTIFCAPIDCRLVGMGFAFNGKCDSTKGLETIKIAAFKTPINHKVQANGTGTDETWTILATMTTSPNFGENADEVKKVNKTFNSSDGDINAGQCVGFMVKALPFAASPDDCAYHYGVITFLFESR